ncbi:MAG: Ig-like domain-containing protein, partial [Actinomycetota bacterium]
GHMTTGISFVSRTSVSVAIRLFAVLALLSLVLHAREAQAAPYPLATYGDTSGAAICDVVTEVNPSYADIACNSTDSASSYVGADDTSAAFGVVVAVDPRVSSNPGPLESTAYVVAIAVDGVQAATVGVDGKQVGGADFVYAKCFGNASFTHTYLVNDGIATGALEIFAEPNSSLYHRVQFQIPFTALAPCGVTPTTPVQLFYGTSQAANLDVINKDYFRGDAVDFAGLATIQLAGTLGVTKSSSVVSGPNPPQTTQMTTYDLAVTVTNPSPAVMTDVEVIDVVPDNVTIVSVTAPVGAIDQAGQTVTWNGFSLAVGETRMMSVRVSVTPTGDDHGDALLLNPGADVTASRAGADQVSASSQPVSSSPVAGAVVAIAKSASPDAVNVGQTVTYTITLTNTGDADAAVTALVDELPAGMSYVVDSTSGSLGVGEPTVTDQTLIWNETTTIPTGSSRTIVFDATAEDAGTFTNNASASGANFSPVSTGPTAEVDSNAPPAAVDDFASVGVDDIVVVDVLDNDSDPEGDTITLGTISTPANGSVTANAPDQTISYEPNVGFEGEDSFGYEICDARGACSTATVDVTVYAPDSPPVAGDDASTTDQGDAIVLNVLSNDVDPGGGTLAIDSVSDPSHGTVVVNPDWSLTYTPDTSFNGTDTFTYTVCVVDRCDSAEVTITVLPVIEPAADDDPPVVPVVDDPVDDVVDDPVDVLDEVTVDEDGRVVIIPVNTDSGLVVRSVSDPAHGTAEILTDGTILYAPDPGYVGVDSFLYELCEAAGEELCQWRTMRVQILEGGSDARGSADVSVTLPRTGADVLKLTALSLLLVAAGLAIATHPRISCARA